MAIVIDVEGFCMLKSKVGGHRSLECQHLVAALLQIEGTGVDLLVGEQEVVGAGIVDERVQVEVLCAALRDTQAVDVGGQRRRHCRVRAGARLIHVEAEQQIFALVVRAVDVCRDERVRMRYTRPW
jgi:hypothetical protein